MGYKNLRAEMARSSVTAAQIAELLRLRRATVSDKINGRSRFFCDEAILIRNTFFSECSIEYLFEQQEKSIA